MHIRRPLVSVVAALALFGGSAALTGCADEEGLGQRTGTSKDDTNNLSGNDPSSPSQGSLNYQGNEAPFAEDGDTVNTNAD